MSNHTYHVSLYRIDSRWVAGYRFAILAAKVDFSAIVAYTTNVKTLSRRYDSMTQDVFFNELLEEGRRGEVAVKKLLEDRG